MDMSKDIIKLIIGICVLVAIVLGVFYLGSKVNNKEKYQHPITRPGAHW